MNSTRFSSLFSFVAASLGLTLLAAIDSIVWTAIGATLVVGSALLLTRHFWREGARKRKQELRAHENAVRAAITKVSLDDLREDVGSLQSRFDVFTQGVLEYIAQLELDITEFERASETRLGESQRATNKRFDSLDRDVSKYRDEILTQVAGVIGVYSILNPSTPYVSFGGWAIGGDCAQRLVTLILSKKPRYIIEAGSGLSTVLAAQAMERLGGEGQVISLEHDSSWLERTRQMLADHGVLNRAQVLFAPLVSLPVGNEAVTWYDFRDLALPKEVELIFIDGPPKATGPLARYPALPLLLEKLSIGGVILMDDAGRPDERAVVERWRVEFPDLEFRYHTDAKGTIEIIKGKG
jgi:predicted O-methyltransferase YrrM